MIFAVYKCRWIENINKADTDMVDLAFLGDSNMFGWGVNDKGVDGAVKSQTTKPSYT